jgi:hypothetical protein
MFQKMLARVQKARFWRENPEVEAYSFTTGQA